MENLELLENKIEDQFLDYLKYGTDIKKVRAAYQQELEKLDEFFELFNEKVDLDPETPYSNEWFLYNTKFKEYEIYDAAINRLTRYITPIK